MDFLTYAKTRQAVRTFSDEPVSRDDIMYCIEAAGLAPSSFNVQPWKFIVVDDPIIRKKVSEAICNPVLKMNTFVREAPVIVIVLKDASSGLSDRLKSIVRKFNLTPYDIGFATEHFCLAAVDKGLGTCILGWFKHARIKDLLFIPDDKEICLTIAVGHPKDMTVLEKDRKPINKICSFNTYE